MLDRPPANDLISDMVREFVPGLPSDDAAARGANLQDAGLTSIATVKLMLAIEAAYDVAIPEDDLTPENFRSIAAIEALVARLRGA
ncbi:MAG: phosphopantetheine-binding protein [Roseiarcus sp.]|jgi:acyl carrier protein